ncbi:hypothetical protein B0H14DRAFT_3567513 [Mycena olivaceomarginata]|nr:hypothetical protein B0H14DRAFT_3567513 [Mycena olivaceomarginata]
MSMSIYSMASPIVSAAAAAAIASLKAPLSPLHKLDSSPSASQFCARPRPRQNNFLDILVLNAGWWMLSSLRRCSAQVLRVMMADGKAAAGVPLRSRPPLLPLPGTPPPLPDAHVRVVTLSSERHGYRDDSNILFTNELQRRLAGTGICSCLSVHPGLVVTGRADAVVRCNNVRGRRQGFEVAASLAVRQAAGALTPAHRAERRRWPICPARHCRRALDIYPLEQQHITAIESIVPTLQNILAIVNLDCCLNFKTIALHARNTGYY